MTLWSRHLGIAPLYLGLSVLLCLTQASVSEGQRCKGSFWKVGDSPHSKREHLSRSEILSEAGSLAGLSTQEFIVDGEPIPSWLGIREVLALYRACTLQQMTETARKKRGVQREE